MIFKRLFFILFLFVSFLYSYDCSCSSGYYPELVSSSTYVTDINSYDYQVDCAQNNPNSYITYTDKTPYGDIEISPGVSEYYSVTKKEYQCYTCSESDVDIVVPDGKVIQPINLEDTSQTGGCPVLDTQKVNECLALPGGVVLSGIQNCCAIYACASDIVTSPESNCTEPYVDDGNGNCVCDTANGYSIDPRTDECTDCLDHFECVMSAGPNSDGMYINYYQVYDCLNVNYADSERIESFNCFDTNCPPGQYFCDKSAQCQLIGSECLSKGSDTNDSQNQSCDYPPTLYEQPFQGIMSTQDCLDHGGWTYSCTDWTVACYYQDDNATDPSAGTTDDTNTDANASGTIDDGNITSDVNMSIDLSAATTRLDTIIDSLSANGAIVKSIGDLSNSINSNLNGLKSSQDRTTDHIDGMNNNLGSKLDDIKNAIDLTETNDLLRSIDDKLHEDHQDEIDDISSKASSLESIVDEAISSVTANYNDIVAVMNGLTPPSLSSSGSCSLTVVILGKTLDLGAGFRDALPILRPVVMFIFNLIFAVLLIRFSILAYRDIQLKAFALFT